MAQRAERVGERRTPSGRRSGGQEERGGHQGDHHQRGDAVERRAPRPLTEQATDQRPDAIPIPRAASNRMMAWAVPPLADITIVASAVATKRALPRPQPARKPTTAPTLFDDPARAANEDDQDQARQQRALRPDPARDDPVTSIATPMIAM
jgi:hypothetical protein